MSSFEEYIASFDVDPGYLDWAAFGPLSPAVRADVTADAELLGSGRPSSIALVADHKREALDALSSVLNIPIEQIVLQPSTGHGLQQAIYGIREGGVLVSRAEFPACTVPVQRAADAFGRITAQFFEPQDGFVTPDVVRAELTDDTAALVVSLIDFRTGYRADLAGIRDVIGPDRLLIVDATQAIGTVTEDWTLADVVCGHGYKWLRAGRGTGFAAFSGRAREQIQPVLSGGAGTAGGLVVDEVGRVDDDAQAYAVAVTDPLAVARLATALGEVSTAGLAEIERKIATQTAAVMALADENELLVITPREPERRGGIVTIAPPAGEVGRLSAALANAGVAVTSRGDTVRVSAHAGTGAESLNLLSDGLAAFTQSRAW